MKSYLPEKNLKKHFSLVIFVIFMIFMMINMSGYTGGSFSLIIGIILLLPLLLIFKIASFWKKSGYFIIPIAFMFTIPFSFNEIQRLANEKSILAIFFTVNFLLIIWALVLTWKHLFILKTKNFILILIFSFFIWTFMISGGDYYLPSAFKFYGAYGDQLFYGGLSLFISLWVIVWDKYPGLFKFHSGLIWQKAQKPFKMLFALLILLSILQLSMLIIPDSSNLSRSIANYNTEISKTFSQEGFYNVQQNVLNNKLTLQKEQVKSLVGQPLFEEKDGNSSCFYYSKVKSPYLTIPPFARDLWHVSVIVCFDKNGNASMAGRNVFFN